MFTEGSIDETPVFNYMKNGCGSQNMTFHGFTYDPEYFLFISMYNLARWNRRIGEDIREDIPAENLEVTKCEGNMKEWHKILP